MTPSRLQPSASQPASNPFRFSFSLPTAGFRRENPHLDPFGVPEKKESFDWFDCACWTRLLSITMKSPKTGVIVSPGV